MWQALLLFLEQPIFGMLDTVKRILGIGASKMAQSALKKYLKSTRKSEKRRRRLMLMTTTQNYLLSSQTAATQGTGFVTVLKSLITKKSLHVDIKPTTSHFSSESTAQPAKTKKLKSCATLTRESK